MAFEIYSYSSKLVRFNFNLSAMSYNPLPSCTTSRRRTWGLLRRSHLCDTEMSTYPNAALSVARARAAAKKAHGAARATFNAPGSIQTRDCLLSATIPRSTCSSSGRTGQSTCWAHASPRRIGSSTLRRYQIAFFATTPHAFSDSVCSPR